MNVRIGLLLVASIVGFLVSSEAIASAWRPFTSEEGLFTVDMPGQPTYMTKKDNTPVGNIDEHIYQFKNDKLMLSAEYSDLPGVAVVFGGTNTIYKKSKEAFLKDVNGTELSFTSFKFDGYPCMALIYNTPTRKGKVHLILVKRRLYFLQASVLKDAKNVADIDTFLNSFKQEYRDGIKRYTADDGRLGDWRKH